MASGRGEDVRFCVAIKAEVLFGAAMMAFYEKFCDYNPQNFLPF